MSSASISRAYCGARLASGMNAIRPSARPSAQDVRLLCWSRLAPLAISILSPAAVDPHARVGRGPRVYQDGRMDLRRDGRAPGSQVLAAFGETRRPRRLDGGRGRIATAP